MLSRSVSNTASRVLIATESPARVATAALAATAQHARAVSNQATPPATSGLLSQTPQPVRASTSAALPRSLPNEMWGEIVGLSLRQDILNLRVTAKEIKSEADRAITSVTLHRNPNAGTFNYPESLSGIEQIRLPDPETSHLNAIAAHFAIHSPAGLTILLLPPIAVTPESVAGLSVLPFAALRLEYGPDAVQSEVLSAMALSECPVEVRGVFSEDALLAASQVRTLTTLEMTDRGFDDGASRMFASHPAVQHLTLLARWDLSAKGLHAVASIPTLRTLSLDESYEHIIDEAVAAKLAANPRFESLEIKAKGPALSESSFEALSQSETLKTLRVPICRNMTNLAKLTSLEHLQFTHGSWGIGVVMDATSARSIADLPNLKTLELPDLLFRDDCLTTLLGEGRASKLVIRGTMTLSDNQMAATLANRHLRDLSLPHSVFSPSALAQIIEHPTLQRLHLNNGTYVRLPEGSSLTLVAPNAAMPAAHLEIRAKM